VPRSYKRKKNTSTMGGLGKVARLSHEEENDSNSRMTVPKTNRSCVRQELRKMSSTRDSS